jgi:DNA-binding HxlR family transcriptional regulator
MDKNNFEIMLLDVMSCKWSHTLLKLIASNVHRPGELQKNIADISVKVMNESLLRLVKYKMLTKTLYNEVPPRVEYKLTSLGKDALNLLNDIHELRKKYETLGDD